MGLLASLFRKLHYYLPSIIKKFFCELISLQTLKKLKFLLFFLRKNLKDFQTEKEIKNAKTARFLDTMLIKRKK